MELFRPAIRFLKIQLITRKGLIRNGLRGVRTCCTRPCARFVSGLFPQCFPAVSGLFPAVGRTLTAGTAHSNSAHSFCAHDVSRMFTRCFRICFLRAHVLFPVCFPVRILRFLFISAVLLCASLRLRALASKKTRPDEKSPPRRAQVRPGAGSSQIPDPEPFYYSAQAPIGYLARVRRLSLPGINTAIGHALEHIRNAAEIK